jgi:simple sugar transport system permease protein
VSDPQNPEATGDLTGTGELTGSGQLGEANVGSPEVLPVGDTGLDQAALDVAEVPEDAEVPKDAEVPEGPASSRALSGASEVLRQILAGSGLVSVLAVVISLVLGGILIAATNPQVQAASSYFFGRPTDTFVAIGQAVGGAYASLFEGGVYDFTASSFGAGIIPLFNSLAYATPLIAAGLGIAVAFRAGLFNIGGQGIILIGGAAAGYAAFTFHLPVGIQLAVAILFGLLGGAIWSGFVGFLKARTGAHEVIVTIMLNYVAFLLIDFLLSTPLLQAPGVAEPKSPGIPADAQFFPLLGAQYQVNFGFILAILATVYCWYLLGRSSLGFKFRAIGENPKAARVAGINVNRMFIYALAISGALVGLAGAYQVLGQGGGGFTNGLDAGIGFQAITVALLGRSRPWGVFAAGILFGIIQAGGNTMSVANQVDVNIVTVLQSVIVLFVAAPPLVRAIFRLPSPRPSGSEPPRTSSGSRSSGKASRQVRKEVVAK